MHSYQHNIKTFNSATRHLTRVERALYRDLIELYYDTEQPLPAVDFDRLARRVMANSDDEKLALKYVLDEFFELTGDCYTHHFCDEQIEGYRSNQSGKSAAGKASAEARRRKAEERKDQRTASSKQNLTGDEQALNGCATNQKPETINQKPITSKEKDISPQAADSDSLSEIFSHWKTIMNHPKAKLDEKRKKKIREALKLGYAQADLIAAIDGCAKSSYHMGQDGRNTTVYDDLELILRDAKHIDQFLKINSMPKAPMASQPKFDPVAYVNQTQGTAQKPIDNRDLPLRVVGNAN